MPAVADSYVRLRLVRVQHLHAATPKRGHQLRPEVCGQRGEGGGGCGNHAIQRYVTWVLRRVERGQAGHMFEEVRRTSVCSQ